VKRPSILLVLAFVAPPAAFLAGRYTAPERVKTVTVTRIVLEPGLAPLPEVEIVYRTEPGACKAARTRAYRLGWESGHRTCRMDRGEPR